MSNGATSGGGGGDLADLLVAFPGGTVVRRAIDGPFVIGRQHPADVCVEHPAISRLHLQLWPGRQWEAIDFDSRNGTYLNGRRLHGGVAVAEGMSVSLASAEGVEITFTYVRAGSAAQHTGADGPTTLLARTQRDGLQGGGRPS